MNKTTAAVATVALVLAAVITVRWLVPNPGGMSRELLPPSTGSAKKASSAPKEVPRAPAADLPPPTREPAETTPATAEEKAARVAKIKRDYDEIRAKTSADYSAAGTTFPGGLNAFLRQLALLEREKRADFAKVLSPRELEELEMRETTAGKLVERLLGTTAATPEQQRAVFRIQRAYEDRFALTFDLTPPALLERETARQQTQEQIRTVLGDELFGAWLAGEGKDYALTAAFAVKNNLPPTAALDLWRIKNDYTLTRLNLAAQKLSSDQQRAAEVVLAQQVEARVIQTIGASVLPQARNGVLAWLPKK